MRNIFQQYHIVLQLFIVVIRNICKWFPFHHHHYCRIDIDLIITYHVNVSILFFFDRFDVKQSCFFTAAIRSRIVQFILDRKRFSNDALNDYAFGIDRLIAEEAYMAAYPLHDGELHTRGSMRQLLYKEWSAVSRWYRYQPLDYIKEYFGVKIGLYFAWLGYYTYMLLLASVVGVACFIYSWMTINDNIPSRDICSNTNDIKMCPLCDYWCDYWDLKETCFHAKVTYLFDNPTTVFFAIFMSFWGE